uniref:hypothetical protein n=1 Tax=Endozoicomonas atrinae TaxID=1333660 RepID=UPI00193101DB
SATTDVRLQSTKARRLVDDAMGAEPYTGLRAFTGKDFFDALVIPISFSKYVTNSAIAFIL